MPDLVNIQGQVKCFISPNHLGMGRKLKKSGHRYTGGHPYHPPKDFKCAHKEESSHIPARYVRLPLNDYKRVTSDGPSSIDGTSCLNVHLLRPSAAQQKSLETAQESQNANDFDSYRMWHAERTQILLFRAQKGHQSSSPACRGLLSMDREGEIKRGLAWAERMKCDSCDFVSETVKLYKKLKTSKPGPKPADINYSLQVGLSHAGMSNTGMARVILASNTPAPSLRHMQRTANKVGELLIQENESDMANIRTDLRRINKMRGLAPDAPIMIEMDARYNNPIYSGLGNTPYQAATQATHVTCEQSTSQKQVIAVNIKSKLCQQARRHEIKTGREVKCPEHPGHCSANLAEDAVIGM